MLDACHRFHFRDWSICSVFVVYSLLFVSCKPSLKEGEDHPEYVDLIIARANESGNLSYLDSAYKNVVNPGPGDLWKKYRMKEQFYFIYDLNIPRARLYIDSMFYMLKGRQDKYPYEYALTLSDNAEILIAAKKYDEAYKAYYDLKMFVEKNMDSCSFSRVCSELANVAVKQEKYLEAIPYLKAALASNEYCGTAKGFAYTFGLRQNYYNTLGFCFEKAGLPDSAVVYYTQGLAFVDGTTATSEAEQKQVDMARGVISGNLGGVYSILNNYPAAEKYLKADIAINSRPGYPNEDAQTAALKLSGLYIKMARFTEADSIQKKLEQEIRQQSAGKSVMNQTVRLRWNKRRWEYFQGLGDTVQAYRYALNYYKIRDTMNDAGKELKMSDMDKAFRDIQRDSRIALLDKDNQLKKISLLSFVVVFLLCICIFLIIWRNLRNTRRNLRQVNDLNQEVNDKNSQLQDAISDLEYSYEENSKMTKIVAHDLRNPIGNIVTISNILINEASDVLNEEQRHYLDLIKATGENSLELITDMLYMNSYKEDLKKEPVDLSALLQHCVDLLRVRAAEKHQIIVLSAEPVMLLLDRKKIWRVINNLVINAIKFSPEKVTIAVLVEKQADFVIIAVKDYGVGIPEEWDDNVFDMFTEAKRTGTGGEEPFGMGLAIAKQIVEAHNGTIWFERREKGGTIFYIRLPAGS